MTTALLEAPEILGAEEVENNFAAERVEDGDFIGFRDRRGFQHEGFVTDASSNWLNVYTTKGLHKQVLRWSTSVRIMPAPLCPECGSRLTLRGCVCSAL